MLDQNPEKRSVLEGTILLAWPNLETLEDWSKIADRPISLSRPVAFSDQNGSDRYDLIDSMGTLDENQVLVQSYLAAVDKVASEIELDGCFFAKVAHNSGISENEVTLVLSAEGQIGKWIRKATHDEESKTKLFSKRYEVGTYSLDSNGQVRFQLATLNDVMLRLCSLS